MTDILETELKGILIRSKAEYIEGAEKIQNISQI